uniref:Uncharacterized protein n=1 Tax=Plectus sambesii TaxID=2011161 RepID=A0A914XFB9_9BILA
MCLRRARLEERRNYLRDRGRPDTRIGHQASLCGFPHRTTHTTATRTFLPLRSGGVASLFTPRITPGAAAQRPCVLSACCPGPPLDVGHDIRRAVRPARLTCATPLILPTPSGFSTAAASVVFPRSRPSACDGRQLRWRWRSRPHRSVSQSLWWLDTPNKRGRHSRSLLAP